MKIFFFILVIHRQGLHGHNGRIDKAAKRVYVSIQIMMTNENNVAIVSRDNVAKIAKERSFAADDLKHTPTFFICIQCVATDRIVNRCDQCIEICILYIYNTGFSCCQRFIDTKQNDDDTFS